MSNDCSISRADLGFVDAVRDSFSLLLREFGFSEAACDDYVVHFQSPNGWLDILHDRASFEIDVALMQKSNSARVKAPFGMADLIRPSDALRAENYRAYSASNSESVCKGVKKLATEMRNFALPALNFDLIFLTQAEQARARAISSFVEDINRTQLNNEVKQAMKRRDWQRIVELYEPVKDQLNATEQKRLAIAKTRASRR